MLDKKLNPMSLHDTCNMWGHMGPLWTIMGHYGPLWTIDYIVLTLEPYSNLFDG